MSNQGLRTFKRLHIPNGASYTFLGPLLDLLQWRIVGRSVCLSTPVTRQPMFGFFSKSVEYSLGEYN